MKKTTIAALSLFVIPLVNAAPLVTAADQAGEHLYRIYHAAYINELNGPRGDRSDEDFDHDLINSLDIARLHEAQLSDSLPSYILDEQDALTTCKQRADDEAKDKILKRYLEAACLRLVGQKNLITRI